MRDGTDPAAYEAWYHTPRGQWIGAQECMLLQDLLRPSPDASLLDVGCGTGYFSRYFAGLGLSVTGLDPDPAALEFARSRGEDIHYLQGSALQLPFPDRAFDHTLAVTSLCFIDEPLPALREMWRVSRHGLVLGLLHRHSLLYRQKHGQGSYTGARWDTVRDVRSWSDEFSSLAGMKVRYGIFLPGGNRLARLVENILPYWLPAGSFLAVALYRGRNCAS